MCVLYIDVSINILQNLHDFLNSMFPNYYFKPALFKQDEMSCSSSE